MRSLRNALSYLPRRTSALIAMFAAAIIVPAVLFAWGPDRPTYTIEHPADHITFNSITNNPNIGDERNFVGIREQGSTGAWQDTMAAQPGKSYVVRMYVHNNAASNLNLVAKDVTAKFNLPTTTATSIQVDGFLSSSNASPKEVYDSAKFTSSKDFNLAYKTGSLHYYNNHFGSNGVAISESAFTNTGAKLGYDKLDGNIPGCFQYAGYLTFVVTPQFASDTTNFTVQKQVRKDHTGAFQDNISAKPGDKLNYRITYTNTGTSAQSDVILKDTLPQGVSYVPGTVRIMNANNPGGATVQNGDTLFSSGINIGSYTGGSNALVIFDATVAANDKLPTCGTNTLTNIASVQPKGQNPKQDSTDVTVPKECQTPQPSYSCDSLTVTKISRTKFSFKTTYSHKNADYKSTEYVVTDSTGKELSRSSDTSYTQITPGTYTVKAYVTFVVDGKQKTVTDANCEKQFTVEALPVTPAYACDALSSTKISRTDYTFTGTASVSGGATIDSYTFDFGDGTTATVSSPTDVPHAYTKAGTYHATLNVTFTANGKQYTKTGEACAVTITITPQECKPGIPVGDTRCEETPKEYCTVPGKETLPKDSPNCYTPCDIKGKENLPKDSKDCVEVAVTELPKTGVSDTITSVFGVGALIAAIGYYIASRRAFTN